MLEEFMYHLLRDCPPVKELGLTFMNKGIFAGLSIDPNGTIVIKKKDVDCAIVKVEEVGFPDGTAEIAVPAVAIECKTYLDKTMWSEAQFTAQLIKRGNPTCKVYLIAETNQVRIGELLPESPVNEVFIIRGTAKEEIDKDTIFDFYNEVENALTQLQIPKIKTPPGRLLHPEYRNSRNDVP